MKFVINLLSNRLVIAIYLVSTFSACKKFVEIDNPINQVQSDIVFSGKSTATSAVTGIYSTIMALNEDGLNGYYSVYPGLSADELTPVTTNQDLQAFANNALLPANPKIDGLTSAYIPAYKVIYQANACIEGLTGSTVLDDLTKQSLIGEVKFMRALSYFYLVNTFGDVPLIITTDYRENQSAPRASGDLVYQQIVSDLHAAQQLLPVNYPTSSPVRPNRLAATALLARVYLFQKNYTGADSAANAVIDAGVYAIEPDLTKIFLANSKEAILQFLPLQKSFNTSEGNSFIPQRSTQAPKFNVSSFLLSAFEAGDARKDGWTKNLTVSNIAYVIPYKYKLGLGTYTTFSEYNMILRYTEQFLIRSEARAMQNNFQGSIDDINAIRAMHGKLLTPLAAPGSQEACLDIIMRERQVELFAEFGHRWYDLKRTGQINAVLGAEKANWPSDGHASLYPIPQSEIVANPFLTQNAGY